MKGNQRPASSYYWIH